jgi:hypothetical protein
MSYISFVLKPNIKYKYNKNMYNNTNNYIVNKNMFLIIGNIYN